MFIAWWFFLFRSSVGAHSLLPVPAKLRCRVSLLTEPDHWAEFEAIDISPRWGEATNGALVNLQVESAY